MCVCVCVCVCACVRVCGDSAEELACGCLSAKRMCQRRKRGLSLRGPTQSRQHMTRLWQTLHPRGGVCVCVCVCGRFVCLFLSE